MVAGTIGAATATFFTLLFLSRTRERFELRGHLAQSPGHDRLRRIPIVCTAFKVGHDDA